MKSYQGMVTSDWSECLSPSRPFDMITFHHPHLREKVEEAFRAYTGNTMTMADALARIDELLPAPMDEGLIDAYLQKGFEVYSDVPAFMDWCRLNDILFMINSTGAIGYFQRVLARRRISPPEVLAASPMVAFGTGPTDPEMVLSIREISDKPRHSAAVARHFKIPNERIVVIGDSGGDGPHFEWGARIGATLVASLAKTSLMEYCHSRNLDIHFHWNPGHPAGKAHDGQTFPMLDLNGLTREIRRKLS